MVALNVESNNARFLMIGDWGGKGSYPYKTTLQKNISQSLAQAANRLKSQFIISLGNNFIDSGVKNVNDFRFQVLNFIIECLTVKLISI